VSPESSARFHLVSAVISLIMSLNFLMAMTTRLLRWTIKEKCIQWNMKKTSKISLSSIGLDNSIKNLYNITMNNLFSRFSKWEYKYRPFKKVNEIEFLIFFISLFLGMTSFAFIVIAVRGYFFHPGSPVILDSAIRGVITLGAFIVIRTFNPPMETHA
jgi:hypothetical protein